LFLGCWLLHLDAESFTRCGELARLLVVEELAPGSVRTESVFEEALALLCLVVLVNVGLLLQLVCSVCEGAGALELALACQLPVFADFCLILHFEPFDVFSHFLLACELSLGFGCLLFGRSSKLLDERIWCAAEEVRRLFPRVGFFFILEVVESWRFLEVRAALRLVPVRSLLLISLSLRLRHQRSPVIVDFNSGAT